MEIDLWSPAALVGMDPEIFSRFRRQLSARPSNMHHPKQNGVMHVVGILSSQLGWSRIPNHCHDTWSAEENALDALCVY